VDVARRFFEDNKKQVQIGTMAPLDVTTAEAQLATSEEALVESETTLEQAQINLKNLLSRNGLADPILAQAEIIPLDHIDVPEKEDLPPMKQLVATAFANRPDLAANDLNLTNSKTSALGTRNGVLPQLSGFASATNKGLSGVAQPAVVSGFSGSTGASGLPSGFIPCPAGVGAKGSICEVPPSSLVGGIGTGLGEVFDRHFPSESAGTYFSPTLRNRQALADQAVAAPAGTGESAHCEPGFGGCFQPDRGPAAGAHPLSGSREESHPGRAVVERRTKEILAGRLDHLQRGAAGTRPGHGAIHRSGRPGGLQQCAGFAGSNTGYNAAN
jgi:hypothetical protein